MNDTPIIYHWIGTGWYVETKGVYRRLTAERISFEDASKLEGENDSSLWWHEDEKHLVSFIQECGTYQAAPAQTGTEIHSEFKIERRDRWYPWRVAGRRRDNGKWETMFEHSDLTHAKEVIVSWGVHLVTVPVWDGSVQEGETIRCTAWEACGEYSGLIDNSHEIRLPGGRVAYHMAAPSRTEQSVRLARLKSDPLRQVNRYVDPDTRILLVPIKRGAQA